MNGAFGIGKTTVAREVVARLPRAVLFDPEIAGIVLQRLLRIVGRPVDDFQDLPLWHRLTIVQIRVARLLWRNVVVPMAFSNAAYLQEIRGAVGRFEPNVLHFCLVAPLPVVQERLRRRGAVNASDAAWQDRRAAECCALHGRQEFARQVDASDRAPRDIAEELIAASDVSRGADRPSAGLPLSVGQASVATRLFLAVVFLVVAAIAIGGGLFVAAQGPMVAEVMAAVALLPFGFVALAAAVFVAVPHSAYGRWLDAFVPTLAGVRGIIVAVVLVLAAIALLLAGRAALQP